MNLRLLQPSEERGRWRDGRCRLLPRFAYGFALLALGLVVSDTGRMLLRPSAPSEHAAYRRAAASTARMTRNRLAP
jgi:hypothetical protein